MKIASFNLDNIIECQGRFFLNFRMIITRGNHGKLTSIKTRKPWGLPYAYIKWRKKQWEQSYIVYRGRMKVVLILSVLWVCVGTVYTCTCVDIPTNGCNSDYCKICFSYFITCVWTKSWPLKFNSFLNLVIIELKVKK